jgi:RNA polymerase sigma-70 factor (ECF subfamily)
VAAPQVDGQAGVATALRDASKEIIGLHDEFFQGIYGYCAFRLFSKDIAEDAACAVFLKLVQEYPNLGNKSGPGMRNWLYGTASNVIAGLLRDAKRQKKILADLARSKGVKPSDTTEYRLDWPALYEAIARLRPQYQDIVALRYFQQLDTAAIAGALGITRVTARVRLMRAVKRLKRELGDRFD